MKCASHVCSETSKQIYSFLKQKHGCLIHTRLDKAFKNIVLNRGSPGNYVYVLMFVGAPCIFLVGIVLEDFLYIL